MNEVNAQVSESEVEVKASKFKALCNDLATTTTVRSQAQAVDDAINALVADGAIVWNRSEAIKLPEPVYAMICDMLTAGMANGTIALNHENGKFENRSKLRAYASSVLGSRIRKCSQYLGGGKYTPDPSKSHGKIGGSEFRNTMNALQVLLSRKEITEEEFADFKAEAEALEATRKATVVKKVTIDLNRLPEHLKARMSKVI